MKTTRVVERLRVTVGDRQVVSLAGLHLVGELADAVGLGAAFSGAVPWAGDRVPVHDRGRLLVQVALMLAGGGRCMADMDALREQPDVFGEVASVPTIWRVFDAIDDVVLASVRGARASARAKVWTARSAPKQLILDVDASLVEIHSDGKEQAASHFKGGYGFHPMLCSRTIQVRRWPGSCGLGTRPRTRVPISSRWSTSRSGNSPTITRPVIGRATTAEGSRTRSWSAPILPARSVRSSLASWPATVSSRSPPA
jgi:Transposase DDE domain group 1